MAVADLRERLVGAFLVGLTLVAIVTQNWLAIVLAGAVVAVGLIRRWAQRRVVLRGRPALDADLSAADDEVRRMAVR